ncbi:hypothetical protein CC86DRAFT_298766 [Ophiobolus disseminans]|uniref:DUF8040 domain-containing protein n=1 Tax=Ophiobolus disseminans TaxID=1469910 RepID=A0A6A6ZRV0_9PLEO|nr:hypothetical protein CC86DRAFT_298766 [Ophiobolus disseminans]
MEGIESPGARRAIGLLFTIPDRFYDFCHLDQKTFFELADWIMANVTSQLSSDISIEESLFMFLDVVARGNCFTNVAYEWEHDVELSQSIFLNVLNALNVLHESKEIDPEGPSFKQTLRARWKGARSLRPGRSRVDGLIKIGADEMSQDGLEVSQDSLKRALEALNNFIHEQTEY